MKERVILWRKQGRVGQPFVIGSGAQLPNILAIEVAVSLQRRNAFGEAAVSPIVEMVLRLEVPAMIENKRGFCVPL